MFLAELVLGCIVSAWFIFFVDVALLYVLTPNVIEVGLMGTLSLRIS
jgi:hypothetical protein